jgi:hypothetical protein
MTAFSVTAAPGICGTSRCVDAGSSGRGGCTDTSGRRHTDRPGCCAGLADDRLLAGA